MKMDVQNIRFTKLSASGNDFVCMDNRDGRFDEILKDSAAAGRFARAICDRHKGIGGDGVIFACHNGDAPEFAEITCAHYESDGSECELCGNGSACFTRYIIDEGIVPDHRVDILTPAGVIGGQCLDDDYVRVCISAPEGYQRDLKIAVESRGQARTFSCDFVITGIPHIAVFVDDLESVDVERWGRELRYHEQFRPRGVNANFVKILGPGRIAMRTFEFGVEAETLACGTGASACSIMAGLRCGDWPAEIFSGDEPVRVTSRSGRELRVYFVRTDAGEVTDVCLESKVRVVYEGSANDEFIRLVMERA